MLSLLSYGEILVDFLPSSSSPINYMPLAGGAPANVAVAYAKLGATSYFAGGISEDNFGEMLFQTLEDEGVNTTLVKRVKDANTALVLVSLDELGERDFNFYRNKTADMLYGKAQIDKITWSNIGIFHYCSNTLTSDSMYNETIYALLKSKENNIIASFDINIRQQLWNDLRVLPERVETCIQKSDIIKLSKDEAEYLASMKGVDVKDYITFMLTLGAKLIIVTDGPHPINVSCENYSFFIEVPAISAIDTTGAGDSFFSGFLFALAKAFEENDKVTSLSELINHQEFISNAILFGSKCGAFTCQQKGAFNALPRLADL